MPSHFQHNSNNKSEGKYNVYTTVTSPASSKYKAAVTLLLNATTCTLHTRVIHNNAPCFVRAGAYVQLT